MKNTHIYQIFYNSETRKNLDPDFIPLENIVESRPDWREYWPIRNYLLNNSLNEDDYYGFFSPKFEEKTGLKAKTVIDFIKEGSSDIDLFNFFRHSLIYVRGIKIVLSKQSISTPIVMMQFEGPYYCLSHPLM